MALLDFLKRKKETEKSKKPAKKAEKILVEKPEPKKKAEAVKNTNPKTKNAKFSYNAIKQPHISEKASYTILF